MLYSLAERVFVMVKWTAIISLLIYCVIELWVIGKEQEKDPNFQARQDKIVADYKRDKHEAEVQEAMRRQHIEAEAAARLGVFGKR
ncbi:hypothetical protein [Methylosinus trichosporium]|uniref:hypothetical protein n=2 Tax=Methylocystaceae TaxID=31993 RepID=UPI0024B9D427|nr:hypothetical protein [Methylosinus trichosporium]